jgi:gas vesicle protein
MDTKQDKVTDERAENASTEEIRTDIKGTRREMDETLDELGERLHPRHLLDDVFDLFRSSPSGSASRDQVARTSKRIGRTVANELKERPLPALLVGAGLVWWIVDANSEDDEHEDAYLRHRRRMYTGTGYAGDPTFGRTVSAPYTTGRVGDGEEEGQSATDKARDMASSAGEKVSDAASAAGEKISGAVSSVGETASEWSDTARDYSARGRRAVSRQASVLQDRFQEASEEYPLAVGGAFLAAGLLTGLLLPRTEREDEWMGEAADEFKDEARRKGEQLVEQGKHAAAKTATETLAETAKTAVSEATNVAAETAEGAASDLKERAKDMAKEAGEMVKREAKSAARKISS